MTAAVKVLDRLLAVARAQVREVLLEPEGLQLIAALGIPVPAYQVVRCADDVTVADLSSFSGEDVVIKVVSPDILHKSDVGGVLVVPRDRAALRTAVRSLEHCFAGQDVQGYLLQSIM